jgi:cell wall-associated NlpC family hydrolase
MFTLRIPAMIRARKALGVALSKHLMSTSIGTLRIKLAMKRAGLRSLATLLSLAAALSIAQVIDTAAPAHAASIGSQLSSGYTLGAGYSIQSTSGAYQFDMQTDGNLVEYGPAGPIWATYTSSPGAYLVNQGDGNLVVYNTSGAAIWASGTNGQGIANLVIQNDGNVVDYKGGSAIWSTYTGGGVSKLAVSGAVAFAKKQLGKPYQIAATGPNSYDCSGLTQAAYASVGVSIARTSQQQYTQGQSVSAAALQPGDLVFYYNSANPTHVAIYIGNGQIIEALKTGTNVKIDNVNYPGAPVGYRRYA